MHSTVVHNKPFLHATIAIHKEPFLHAIIAKEKEPFLHAITRIPTGLFLMVNKNSAETVYARICAIGHDESVSVHESADVFWYALAFVAYMVRASLLLYPYIRSHSFMLRT